MSDTRVIDEVYGIFASRYGKRSAVQKMADVAGMTRQAVYRWFAPDMGYVHNRGGAILIAQHLLELGSPIAPARLMALPSVSDLGARPAGRKGKKKVVHPLDVALPDDAVSR